MIEIETGTTRVLVAPVADEGASRRERERTMANRLAARLLGAGTVITHNADGSPCIEGAGINISVSHSQRLVAVAVDPQCKIGIDIEGIRPRQIARVARRVLSDAELEAYGADDETLTRAWTLKEALYKACGVPGADWRTDLPLPLDAASRTVTAYGEQYEIVICRRCEGDVLTLVRRLSSRS